MIGWKAWCALLLGGAVGVTGTVTVQKKVSAKPRAAVVQRIEHRASNPKVAGSNPARSAILDCPLIGSPFAAEPNTIALPMIPPQPLGSGTPDGSIPGVWGGGSALLPPPNFPGAVPEPDAWALWIGGFGLVGLSFRRRGVA